MATIDLIVLGMLKKESLSAYDIQKIGGVSQYIQVGKDQYPFNIQKGHSTRKKRICQKLPRKRRKNAGKSGLFSDSERRRTI